MLSCKHLATMIWTHLFPSISVEVFLSCVKKTTAKKKTVAIFCTQSKRFATLILITLCFSDLCDQKFAICKPWCSSFLERWHVLITCIEWIEDRAVQFFVTRINILNDTPSYLQCVILSSYQVYSYKTTQNLSYKPQFIGAECDFLWKYK